MKTAYYVITILLLLCANTYSQKDMNGSGDKTVESFSPSRKDYSPELMKQLQLPKGFSINVFAKDLSNPRMLCVGPDGTVYVTEFQAGQVTALFDKNGTGTASTKRVIAKGLDNVHGITILNNKMYLCTPRDLYVANLLQDGSISKPKLLTNKLPKEPGHNWRTIAFGPDGMLYICIGSTCNACKESDPERATILQANPDGSNIKIFAKGLRNTEAFNWHPATKEMWGMDNGFDMRGNDQPPEELNKIEKGKNYGWPYCYGNAQADPLMDQPDKGTKEEYCLKTTPMVMGYTAHAAPIQLVFYTGNMFPNEYKNDAFVTFHGSWNRKPASGYEVVRIRFNNGKPEKFEQFVKGFLIDNGQSQFGRPAGLCVAKDGSLLFSDDDNGVIYRVSYSNKK